MRALLLWVGLLSGASLYASEPSVVVAAPETAAHVETPAPPEAVKSPALFQVLLQRHDAAELQAVLAQVQAQAKDNNKTMPTPIELVLTGDEVRLFVRKHYREHKALVDMAARLHAFNLLTLKVGEDYLAQQGLVGQDLPSFVVLVTNGAAEIQRLSQQGYQPLGVENPT